MDGIGTEDASHTFTNSFWGYVKYVYLTSLMVSSLGTHLFLQDLDSSVRSII